MVDHSEHGNESLGDFIISQVTINLSRRNLFHGIVCILDIR